MRGLRRAIAVALWVLAAVVVWTARRAPAAADDQATTTAQPEPTFRRSETSEAGTATAPAVQAAGDMGGPSPDLTGPPPGQVPGDGTAECPPDHPIKGNSSSMIYHLPGQSTYAVTIPGVCFATEADAQAAGYRARKGH